MLQVGLLAAALAADAAAVTAGLAAAHRSVPALVRASVVFGVFQAVMAGLGAAGGVWLGAWLGTGLPWFAFVVLGALGVRMIVAVDEDTPMEPGWASLLSLGLATSVDALAAGVTLPAFPVPVVLSVGTVGLVTGLLCGAAGAVGWRAGARYGGAAQRLGGAVLIAVGVLAVWPD